MMQLQIEPAALFSRTGVRYEVACDVVGAVLSHFAEVAAAEGDISEHGTQRLAEAQRLMAELRDIRAGLDPRDGAAIEDVIGRLAPLARHLYEDRQEGSQEARRAAQFDEANASLRLEGLTVSVDDLAIQARIIRGELSHDQAAAWYQRRASS